MIQLNVKHGSPEWIAARMGMPTASQFHRIITPKTAKPSTSADRYIAALCAEWLLGVCLDKGDDE